MAFLNSNPLDRPVLIRESQPSVTAVAVPPGKVNNPQTLGGGSAGGGGGAANAEILTGSFINSTVTGSSLTSLGTIANLQATLATIGTLTLTRGTISTGPINPQDITNKQYVDQVASGGLMKAPVKLTSASPLVFPFFGNQSVDGVFTVTGDRVLIHVAINMQDCGIWVANSGPWTRALDMDTWNEAAGATVFVTNGNIFHGTGWTQIVTGPGTIGTTPQTWSQIGSSGATYTAGTGLTLSGSNVFSITNTAVTPGAYGNATNVPTFTVNAQGQLILAGNVAISFPVPGPANAETLTGAFVNPTVLTASFNSLTPASGTLTVSGEVRGTVSFASLHATPYFVGISATAGTILYGSVAAPSPTQILFNNSLILGIDGLGIGVIGNIRRQGTTRTPFLIGPLADATTYNALAFDNVLSANTGMTIAGGGQGGPSPDPNLYHNVPTGGGHQFRVQGANVAFISAGGIQAPSFVGNLPIMDFNGGVGASATTFWRGDGVWATPPAGGGGSSTFGIFNVRDYGAVGDDATDDSTAITNAKNAAMAAHGVLYFPAGNYRTSSIGVNAANGLTIRGDGMGISTIRVFTPSVVLHVTNSTRVTIHGLTLNGNYTSRPPTGGQQALIVDTTTILDIYENEILSSGEFAMYIGGTSAADVRVHANRVGLCWADGINIGHVDRYVVSNNIVDGADDDGIAANGTHGVIIGNYIRHRPDSLTATGRGIWCGDSVDLLIIGNIVDNVKQSGIYLNNEFGPIRRVKVIGNIITNTPRISGQPIAFVGTEDCSIEDNTVSVPPITTAGLIEIANWKNLLIRGNRLLQTNNGVFCRGIHVDEGTGYAVTIWPNLIIKDNTIHLTGDGTNSCIYLEPNAPITMDTVIIDGNVCKQQAGGTYLQLSGSRTTTMGKVVNNTTMSAGTTVSPPHGGIFTVQNNW